MSNYVPYNRLKKTAAANSAWKSKTELFLETTVPLPSKRSFSVSVLSRLIALIKNRLSPSYILSQILNFHLTEHHFFPKKNI